MSVRIASRLGEKSNSELVTDTDHYLTNMRASTLFGAPNIVEQMNATATAQETMQNAMSAPLSETKFDNVKSARKELERNLNLLMSMVQALANSPAIADDQREAVVHSAGMTVKAKASRTKQIFSVEGGELEGSVVLFAETAPNIKSHLWEYTSDVTTLNNRIAIEPTTVATVTVLDLEKFTKYAFFHKPIKSDEVGKWEGPLFYTVLV